MLKMAVDKHFDSIMSYLAWDHDRLDGLIADVKRAVGAKDFGAAREPYSAFDEGLRRHIRVEETILFPFFEVRTGTTTGPTAVMREEHREIEHALELMAGALDREDGEGFGEAQRFFEVVIEAHNSKEENVLYPMSDRLLSDEERERFVARLVRE
jgi:hemerythrin-like domain-containing protein